VRGALALFGAERVEVDVVRADGHGRRYTGAAVGDDESRSVVESELQEPPPVTPPRAASPMAELAAVDGGLGELPCAGTAGTAGTGTAGTAGTGTGLPGLVERAQAVGGTATAGPVGNACFRLRVEVPGEAP
jgi:hypothetical protein